jgi:hypothetical protein
VLGLALVSWTAPAGAEWKFPSLNPFKTEKREISSYTPPPEEYSAALDEEPPKSGFKLPSMKMPKLSSSPKPPGQPSAMQKVGRSTKNFFSKTADVLTPWDNDKKTAPRARTATGVRRTYAGSPSAEKEEKKSFLPNWFSKKDAPEEPRTVNGFIAQPRPRF